MRWLGVVLVVGCVEDRSRAEGELCWENEDCVRPLVCDGCMECRPRDYPTVGLLGDAAEEACDEMEAREEASEETGDTITCRDGERSPTCTSCEPGCCSGHGGCV